MSAALLSELFTIGCGIVAGVCLATVLRTVRSLRDEVEDLRDRLETLLFFTERRRPMSTAKEWRESLGFRKIAVIGSAKRCGVQWTPWMGDWFTSWSPRNSNSHAEGTWEHWVTLAQRILNDPLTEIVRPEVYRAVPEPEDQYDGTHRMLTDEELRARLGDER